MATAEASVLSGAPPMAPLPNQNQVDAQGLVSKASIARAVFDAHKKGLEARRERDLLSEKLLLHIDGAGDWQWADILYGTRVEIPRLVSEFRKTENLLRPVVDNAVAHHTTMPLRFFAESSMDRKSKERAIIDTLWANHLARQQDLNGLFAEALYLAMPAGFCPVHAYWRDDVSEDWYEPIGYGEDDQPVYGEQGPAPGMIDCFVGNPFDHVFDRGAKRGSVRWSSYGRMLPADLVREHWSHVPEARGLEGSNKVPSASEFQRIARDWMMTGLGIHGSPVLRDRRTSGDELIAVICLEIAPTRSDPLGRLQIVAVPGLVDTRRGEGSGAHAVLLADQPLPAGDFSWTNFYSHQRGSDIHGKPWVEDLDQLQVDLNIALSKRWEFTNKLIEAPIVAPGGAIAEDMADIGGYNLLEVEPSLAAWRPKTMEWSQAVIPALNNEIEEKRRAIYTIGGYQASSRGEAPGSRMAYRAIVALQQADNTVHGPVNMRFQRSACDFMLRCHRQMRTYGDVPWLMSVTGDEYAHLAGSYVAGSDLSPAPQFRLVNAFGSSPELRAQEILQLMGTRGADGEPFLRTEEARRQYPNPMVFDAVGDPRASQRRRARTVAHAFVDAARAYREQTGLQEANPQHPWVQQAAMQVFQMMEQRYQRLRTDDLGSHIAAYTEIHQDPEVDPIAVLAIGQRLDLYFQWQASMSGMPAQGPGHGPARPTGPASIDPRAVAAETRGRQPTIAATAR